MMKRYTFMWLVFSYIDDGFSIISYSVFYHYGWHTKVMQLPKRQTRIRMPFNQCNKTWGHNYSFHDITWQCYIPVRCGKFITFYFISQYIQCDAGMGYLSKWSGLARDPPCWSSTSDGKESNHRAVSYPAEGISFIWQARPISIGNPFVLARLYK